MNDGNPEQTRSDDGRSRPSTGPVDELLRRIGARFDPVTSALVGLALASWPVLFWFVPGPGWRSPVTSEIFLAAGSALAAGLLIARPAHGAGEVRAPRRKPRSARRLRVFASLLALPALTLIATLPLLAPSLRAAAPWRVGVAVVSALAAAWMTYSVVRRLTVALGLTPRRPGTARWLKRCGRALVEGFEGTEEASESDQPFELHSRGLADMCLLTELAELDVVIRRGSVVIRAARGHLPTASRERIEDRMPDGVSIGEQERIDADDAAEDETPRLLVRGGSPADVGRVAGEIAAAWSNRGGTTADTERSDAARGPSGPIAGRRQRFDALGAARAIAAVGLVGVCLYALNDLWVVFPVWEAPSSWAFWIVLLAVAGALAHAVPAHRSGRVPISVTEGAGRELRDLLWAMGAAVDESGFERVSSGRDELAPSIVLTDASLRGRLKFWDAGAGPWGRVIAERLELELPDGEISFGASALTRLRALLDRHAMPYVATGRWTQHVEDERREPDSESSEAGDDAKSPHTAESAEDGPEGGLTPRPGAGLVISARRAIGSGRGPWQSLAWHLGDEGVLLEGSPDADVVVPAPAPPTSVVLREIHRRPPGLRHLAASVGVALVVAALPRVGSDLYPVPPEAGDDTNVSAQAELAVACPPAGESVVEGVSALRCLANASGQGGRPLDSLDWAALLEPVAAAVDAMASVADGRVLGCGEVAGLVDQMQQDRSVELAIALLERHRPELWHALKSFWPSRVVRAGRRLEWDELDRAFESCLGTVDQAAVEQAAGLFSLSRDVFETLYGAEAKDEREPR